ncbi:MAG: PH domain-containing protein [Dehalococcoidia bacterium]
MSKLSFRPSRAGDQGQVFYPASRQGAWYPGIAGGIALLLAVVLIARAVVVGISFAGFLMLLTALVLVVVGGLGIYWAWACMTLDYRLDGGILSIRWGLVRHDVPVALFERIVRGRSVAMVRVSGLDWPGCHVGAADVPRLGHVRFLSLHRSGPDALYLIGPNAGYAISVADSAGFIRALQAQMEVVPDLASPQIEMHPILHPLAWQDRATLSALSAAAVLAILATGIIFGRYAGLADQVVLNFPDEGQAGARTALLGIPALAWLLLIGNGLAGVRLSSTRRASAFTLLYGLTFLEGLLVIAAVTAV